MTTFYTSNDVIPPALRNLVGYLEDAVDDVDIAYGPIRDVSRRHLFIGDSIDEDEIEWVTIGAGAAPRSWQFESTFTVTAVSQVPGNGPQESLEDVYELRAVVESVIRSNTTLGLPGGNGGMSATVLVGRLRHQFLGHDEGIGCVAGLIVRIKARL